MSPNNRPKGKTSSNQKVELKEDLIENLELKADLDSFAVTDWKHRAYSRQALSSEFLFSPSARSRASAYDTIIAPPHEIYSFIYKLGRESRREHRETRATRLDNLSQDFPIPDPISFEASEITIGSTPKWSTGTNTARTVSYKDTFTPSWIFPDRPNSAKNLNRKSFLEMPWEVPDYGSVSKMVQVRKEESPEKRTYSISFVSSSDESLKPSEIIRDRSGVQKKTWVFPISEDLQTLYPRDSLKLHEERRSNSLDFAFSEANELSRIETSTLKSPKDIKEFLTRENKNEEEKESYLMQLMKKHLSCGRRKIVMSKSKLRDRVKRDEERRCMIQRVSWKQESAIAEALKREATQHSDLSPNVFLSSPPPSKRTSRRINKIEEKDSIYYI